MNNPFERLGSRGKVLTSADEDANTLATLYRNNLDLCPVNYPQTDQVVQEVSMATDW